MSQNEHDRLIREVMADPVARAAAAENDLRRKIGAAIEAERAERKLSVRNLAKEIGTSVSQVQRLLHQEVGGSLTLRTIVRAAQALDLALDLQVRARSKTPTAEWTIPAASLRTSSFEYYHFVTPAGRAPAVAVPRYAPPLPKNLAWSPLVAEA